MIFIIKYIKIIASNNLYFITFNFNFVKRKVYKIIIFNKAFIKMKLKLLLNTCKTFLKFNVTI